MESALICSYALDGTGGGKEIPIDELTEQWDDKTLLWSHWNWSNDQTNDWFNQHSDLSPIVINAFLEDETRPRLLEYEKGILVILRGINLNPRSNPEDMVSIRIWLEKNRIISARRKKLMAIEDLRKLIHNNNGPKTPGQFLATLTNLLFNKMEPIINEIVDNIDEHEEQVILSPSSSLRSEIVQLHKQIIKLRRYIAPQRDVMNELLILGSKIFKEEDLTHIRENHNRVIRFVEDLDSARERCSVVQEELSSRLAETMNKNMYMLSIVAAIFLPLGFLTGLLGINVGGIPGAENPASFWIFCGILAIIAVVGIAWMRWKKWL